MGSGTRPVHDRLVVLPSLGPPDGHEPKREPSKGRMYDGQTWLLFEAGAARAPEEQCEGLSRCTPGTSELGDLRQLHIERPGSALADPERRAEMRKVGA